MHQLAICMIGEAVAHYKRRHRQLLFTPEWRTNTKQARSSGYSALVQADELCAGEHVTLERLLSSGLRAPPVSAGSQSSAESRKK